MAGRYDKTNEFKRDIEPKMQEIQDLCLKHKIPFFAVFGLKQNPNTTLEKNVKSNAVEEMEKTIKSNVVEEDKGEKAYCLVPALFEELETSDKTFGKLVAVMNGAQPVLNSEARGLDIEDLGIGGTYENVMPDRIK